MVDKLLSFEPSILKLATFSLRTLIRERAFLDEFLRRGGMDALQEVIKRATGNTLAYSLLSMQSLMDLDDRGWEQLEDGFVSRIVEIIGKALDLGPSSILTAGPVTSHRAPHQHLSAGHRSSPQTFSPCPSPLFRRCRLHRLVSLCPSFADTASGVWLRRRLERDRATT